MDIDIEILNKPFPIYTERAQFDKLVAELGTYDNFKDKFNSMTQEELEKWTLVFSEVKNSTVMSAVSTLFMKNRTKFWTSKKYSLLWHKKQEAIKQCITDIIWLFPISPKQIAISDCFDCDVQKFWITIPNIADNKKMLVHAIKLFGFDLSYEEVSTVITKHFKTPWIILTFEADFREYNKNI